MRVLEEQSKEPVTSAMGDPKLVQTGIATGKVSAQVIDEISGIAGVRYVKAVGPQEAMEGSADDGLVHFQLVAAKTGTARMGRDVPGGYPHLIVGTQVDNACSIPVPHQITGSPGRLNIALYEWEPTSDVECKLGGLRHGPYEVELNDLQKGDAIYINRTLTFTATETGSFVAEASPTETANDKFSDQQTRVAPTVAAIREIAPTIARIDSTYGKWLIGGTVATLEQQQRYGVKSSRSVRYERQQYTCGSYMDGSQIARVNLRMDRLLKHTVTTNAAGEHQGLIRAKTEVGDTDIPVQWMTWTTTADHIRIRGNDAVLLVQAIREHGAVEFRVELYDDGDLSRAYDVSDLIGAINANDMDCFEGQ